MNLDVDRQTIAVCHDIPGVARRDIDRLASEPQSDRRSGRRLIREEQRDAHLQRLGLAGGLQMQLHDEVAGGIEPPGAAFWRRPRTLARRPPEHVPGRIGRIGHHAAGVARFRVQTIQMP